LIGSSSGKVSHTLFLLNNLSQQTEEFISKELDVETEIYVDDDKSNNPLNSHPFMLWLISIMK
jgi:hypothetical protein